jgi:hypothetical protein
MTISNGVKIAIISDTHDNSFNLKKFFDYCLANEIKTIIHCGDLDHLANLIEIWPDNLETKIHFVYGNGDFVEEINQTAKSFNCFRIYGQTGEIVLENKKIAFTHFPDRAKILARSQKYDYVFYGHTHKPWEESLGKTKIINPGNLCGTFYQPSFAVLDLEKNIISLKILGELS